MVTSEDDVVAEESKHATACVQITLTKLVLTLR